jgi:hypothetical protein
VVWHRPEIIGDRISHMVNWKSGADIGRLSGQPVRLRFGPKDADLYSLQFADSQHLRDSPRRRS